MSCYRTCPHCGANLDSGESCDCIPSRYAALTPANRERLDAMIGGLLREQNGLSGATNTEQPKQTPNDH